MIDLKRAITWMRDKLNLNPKLNVNPSEQKTKIKYKDDFSVGNIYIYIYDPKTKATLPYYDKFPVVILLQVDTTGFLALNLHYLPPKYRLVFLYKLLPFATKDKDNSIKKLNVTYELLQAASQLKEFKPCLKRYLFGHVKSKLYKIPSDEWEMVSLLPSNSFEKASAQKIWEDSLNIIKEV